MGYVGATKLENPGYDFNVINFLDFLPTKVCLFL